MTRIWHWIGPAVALAIAASGCNDPGSPWYVPPQQSPSAHTTVAEAPDGTADPDAPSGESKSQGTDADEARDEVREFLNRLSDAETGDAPQEEPATLAPPSPPDPERQVATPSRTPKPDSVLSANVPMELGAAQEDETAVPVTEPMPEKPRIEAVVVRPPTTGTKPSAQEPKLFNANAPLATDAPIQDETLAANIERLRTHVAESPNDLNAQWRLSFLQLAAGRDADAANVSNDIALEAAGIISDTIRLVAGVRRAVLEPGPATDEAVSLLDTLRHHLTKDAELLIPKVALCTRVNTFGVYDEMPPEQFLPYQANRTIVYCELKNFSSEQTPDDRFRVTISSHLELLTNDGDVLWEHAESDIEDLSRQRRADFFLAQLVTFPPTVGPGEYVLKVTIEDVAAAKACQAVCPLRIEAPTLTSATR